MDAPFLSVLVPAYNEESGLARNMELLWGALERLGIGYEILIVDDASTDRTAAIAGELAAHRPEIRLLRHAANLGIGGGFLTGVAQAAGEWMILIPADLALDLSQLPHYLRAAQDADVVVGLRSDRSDYSALRMLVSWANIRLIQLLFGMRERQFNYISMYRTSLLRRMDVTCWRSAFFHAETLIKARAMGYRLAEVEIRYLPRTFGRATGARARLIVSTLRDMATFWLQWVVMGQRKAWSRSGATGAGLDG